MTINTRSKDTRAVTQPTPKKVSSSGNDNDIFSSQQLVRTQQQNKTCDVGLANTSLSLLCETASNILNDDMSNDQSPSNEGLRFKEKGVFASTTDEEINYEGLDHFSGEEVDEERAVGGETGPVQASTPSQMQQQKQNINLPHSSTPNFSEVSGTEIDEFTVDFKKAIFQSIADVNKR